jgi:hypothetical protein
LAFVFLQLFVLLSLISCIFLNANDQNKGKNTNANDQNKGKNANANDQNNGQNSDANYQNNQLIGHF